MSFVAAAIGGAAIIGGSLISSNASKQAADTQAGAAANAAQVQQNIYNQQREDQAPWRDAGKVALSQMADPKFQQGFSSQDFQQDPGYQFRLQQGQDAIERSAAARGGLMSGATMKSLSDYNQGAASQEYQNAYNRFNNDRTLGFNRLASLAGVGQTAVNQMGADGNAYANGMSNSLSSIGNAQAAGMVGQANAINNGISQGLGTWQNYNMMNKMFPGSPAPNSGMQTGAPTSAYDNMYQG